MIRISQVKLKPGHSQHRMDAAVRSILRLPKDAPVKVSIVRRSIDARDGIFYCYTLDVEVLDEEQIQTSNRVTKVTPIEYKFPVENVPMGQRPIVVGFGPAGIFAALVMAKQGMKPMVIEQGADMETRTQQVMDFWHEGNLNPMSNVQFGEGGAGAFSDGKLNTNTKDATGRNKFVLETLVEFGASPDILIDAMPHVGTDKLRQIIPRIRKQIEDLGGEIHFEEKMLHLNLENGQVTGIQTTKAYYKTDAVVLAIGHSARDTYYTLYDQGVTMTAKPFACGLRIQHPQTQINKALYGQEVPEVVGPAPYKLTYNTPEGRGVYSFCMCPGGYVVNSSSETGRLCVNGMSYSQRDGENANSAIVVSVRPEDYEGDGPLAGIEFQRKMEQRAYESANGQIPVQTFGDYKRHEKSHKLGQVNPVFRGNWQLANLRGILPANLEKDIINAITYFSSHRIKGFDRPDAIMAAVEARTSSPVRIDRDNQGQSISIRGLFPAGEGAGYAGGITSAAMDGIKAAEYVALVRKELEK